MDLAQRLRHASYEGVADEVAALLATDPDLCRSTDEHGKTPLHWAAESDQATCARLLLEAGADPEARSSWGASPFDWASTMGSGRVADLLLSRGASGLTLITGAALGHLAHVRAVLQSEVVAAEHRRRDAPSKPDDYWPHHSAHILGDILGDALYAAARNGHTETVAALFDHGAFVDAKGVFGGTGLHWAAINGHSDTVDLLLSHGASRTILDASFIATPAQWAREGGHVVLERLLQGD